MKVAIIGHGGHAKVVQEILNEYPEHKLVAFLDDKYSTLIEKEDYVCAPLTYIRRLMTHFYDIRFINAIGDNGHRKDVFDRLEMPNEFFLTLIHSKAVVSPTALIGDGTVIMPNAVVNAGAEIKDHTIVNTGAIVEHDAKVGSFAHISPNATLLGNVKVEKGAHVGSGSTILPNLKVGEWTKIGAGATVVRDIPDFSTAVGVPAQVIKENSHQSSQEEVKL